jgi:chaperonin GroEL (HSP60 family)
MYDATEGELADITAPEAVNVGTESARDINFAAVRAVVDTVSSTLGPRGNDKLIEQPDGEVLITNDTETILGETTTRNPVASLAIDVAEAVDHEYDDGSTTAIVLTGALLDAAEDLLDRGVSANVVARGYGRALRHLDDELEELKRPARGDETTRRAVETAITGKGFGMARSDIVDLVFAAADSVRNDDAIDTDRIRTVTQTGQATADSTVTPGVALANEPVRQAMPSEVEDGRVLLIRGSIELTDTKQKTSIDIGDAESFTRFHEQEAGEIRELAERVTELGADAVLCSRSIADEAQSVLSRDGVLAVRQVDDDALSAIATELDATVVSGVAEASAADLGRGSLRRDESDELLLVEGEGERRPTIVLRGPTQHVADELERHVRTGLEVVAAADGGVVGGAGALEAELACGLRRAARSIDGREQLAFEAFADALDRIPRTLAERAGVDPVDALISLRTAHDAGDQWTGIGAGGDFVDALEAGVVEPVEMKRQVLSSATEATTLVLRIDDVLTVHELSASVSD